MQAVTSGNILETVASHTDGRDTLNELLRTESVMSKEHADSILKHVRDHIDCLDNYEVRQLRHLVRFVSVVVQMGFYGWTIDEVLEVVTILDDATPVAI